MTRPEAVLREQAFHRSEVGREPDTRFDPPDKYGGAAGLLDLMRGLVVKRESEIERLRMAMQEARLELKRGRRLAWKRCWDTKAILEEALQGRDG